MIENDNQIGRLAEALGSLVEFVPANKDDLRRWYDQADRLRAGKLLAGAPHFLWHYLSDADIRMKDEVYAKMQGRRINLLLMHLNRGEMPTDEDTELSA